MKPVQCKCGQWYNPKFNRWCTKCGSLEELEARTGPVTPEAVEALRERFRGS